MLREQTCSCVFEFNGANVSQNGEGGASRGQSGNNSGDLLFLNLRLSGFDAAILFGKVSLGCTLGGVNLLDVGRWYETLTVVHLNLPPVLG